jgi:hypothetical protein
MECKNIRDNLSHCNCTYAGCPRKGKCCECVQYHRVSGELPACYFNGSAERSYDRSMENYLKNNR